MPVRTRFAPSPTGYMHIGGMRTALFAWLWARHNHGQFILRIDDTDQERNIDEALGPILEAFRWLGLDWDEGPEVGGPYGPYFQSQRRAFYDAALAKLLLSGSAYRDFESPQETQAQRESAEKEKRVYVSSRVSLELSAADSEKMAAEGKPFVVRLQIPRSDKVVINDHIRGKVEFDCSLMPDPVIARSDGSPLYNFATVVDDAAFEITHVIRAEEHLSNTPIQVLLHRALDNKTPEWAHIPYVASPGSKEKMSKRKIDKYRTNPQFQKLFELGDQVLGQHARKAPHIVDILLGIERGELAAQLGQRVNDLGAHLAQPGVERPKEARGAAANNSEVVEIHGLKTKNRASLFWARGFATSYFTITLLRVHCLRWG